MNDPNMITTAIEQIAKTLFIQHIITTAIGICLLYGLFRKDIKGKRCREVVK